MSTINTRIGCYSALSEPLDRLAGRRDGHALRVCLLGFAVGRELGFSTAQLADLLATILLKDLVPSQSQQADGHGGILRLFERLQRSFGRMADVPMTIVEAESAQLAELADQLDLTPSVRKGLATVRERWDGTGPLGLEANAIPLSAAITLAAEAAEIAWTAGGPRAAKSVVRRGSGKAFSPDVVSAFDRASRYPRYWQALEQADLRAAVIALEPANRALPLEGPVQECAGQLANDLSARLQGLRAASSGAAKSVDRRKPGGRSKAA